MGLVFLALPVDLGRVWGGFHVFPFLSCRVLRADPAVWPFMTRDCSELRFFVSQFFLTGMPDADILLKTRFPVTVRWGKMNGF